MSVTEILYRQAQEKQCATTIRSPETPTRKCAYPSCQDTANWKSYCWFHYQEERYTSR